VNEIVPMTKVNGTKEVIDLFDNQEVAEVVRWGMYNLLEDNRDASRAVIRKVHPTWPTARVDRMVDRTAEPLTEHFHGEGSN
jgi:hypothetical protein